MHLWFGGVSHGDPVVIVHHSVTVHIFIFDIATHIGAKFLAGGIIYLLLIHEKPLGYQTPGLVYRIPDRFQVLIAIIFFIFFQVLIRGQSEIGTCSQPKILVEGMFKVQ
ncbi:hypothetical protein SDC9_174010 [bioreactor metagenome]|uniref:Uncharacterized protein n=1 Tax=bioreactor metagenome TaxID=1076179 RepID=A0A645GIQ3_9ZZZZ